MSAPRSESGRTPRWVLRCRALVASARFQQAVIVLIVANAVVLGLETSRAGAEYDAVFGAVSAAVGVLFVAELAVKIGAHWPTPRAFFRDGWNVFDLAVVVASLLPAVGPLATIARTARLLRVARVVTALPELRLIVATMLRSIGSLVHIAALIGLLLYVYALIGVQFFRDTDPARWRGLGTALLTLFQILTLEGWVDAQAATLGRHPWAWIYFASFIVIAVFVVVNLFIAVVISNLEAAKAHESAQAARRDPAGQDDLSARVRELRGAIERLETAMDARRSDARRPDTRSHPTRASA